MSVEEVNGIIPEGDNPQNAFDVVCKLNFMVLRNLDPRPSLPQNKQKIAQAVNEFVSAGFGFLANKGYDDHFKEIGEVAWRWCHALFVDPWITNDMAQTLVANKLGDDSSVERVKEIPDLPFALIESTRIDRLAKDRLSLLMPISFMSKAQEAPIEALAGLVNAGSRIRDFANGVHLVNPDNINPRANAFEAEFIKETLTRYPHIKISDAAAEPLILFPNGLKSLDPNLHYKGVSGKQPDQLVYDQYRLYAHSNN